MTQNYALTLAAATQHHHSFASMNVEVDSAQYRVSAKSFLKPAYHDEGWGRHYRERNSLVRKKSATRMLIEAATTAEVVARPTPSAPPWAPRPWWHAIIAIT